MARIGIRRLRLLEGAAAASEHVVVIDVLRAATTTAYALAGGAKRVVFVATADEAMRLRLAEPDALLVGEEDGRVIAGFDLDNSPTLIEQAEVRGKSVILRTSAGTQGLGAVRRPKSLHFACFANAAATVKALRERASPVVSLVAIGERGILPAEEDEACAAYLEALLRGRSLPAEALIADVRKRLSKDHPAPTWAQDVERAFSLDRFDVAVEVVRQEGLLVALPTAR